jgi:predicted CoA-binding protein
MEQIKTLIIGASLKPERFSHLAIKELVFRKFPVVAMGLREGTVAGITIEKPMHPFEGIHTVTLYIGERNQAPYYDYILNMKPERVIFNPGTENPEFENQLAAAGIGVVRGCTLVMLSNGAY